MMRLRSVAEGCGCLAMLMVALGLLFFLAKQNAPVASYQIATPGVDDHVAYRLDRATGDVCRIDFLEKATRCANAEATVEIPYPENRIEEIPE